MLIGLILGWVLGIYGLTLGRVLGMCGLGPLVKIIIFYYLNF